MQPLCQSYDGKLENEIKLRNQGISRANLFFLLLVAYTYLDIRLNLHFHILSVILFYSISGNYAHYSQLLNFQQNT